MSEIKKFLRFEISGYIVILYTFLFIIAFFDFNKINLNITEDILGLSVSGFIVAAPLGYLMHQIDVYILNPFKEKRWGKERKAIKLLKEYIKDNPKFKGIKPQIALEIIKCLSNEENKFNYKYFEKEISNRYSYYYSRVEAGIFSPVFGFLIFLIITGVIYFNFKYPIVTINFDDRSFLLRELFIICSFILIFIISILNLMYCKTLLEEIDDMEYVFVEKYKEKIEKEFTEES